MKKGCIILGLTLAVVLLAVPPANASEATRPGALFDPQVDPKSSWGLWTKRVGTSEFPFLKIGQGARPEALGGAFTAIADDINAAFWNPAGLAHIEHSAYTLNYTRWLAGSKLLSGALAFNVGFGVLGLSMVSFSVEKFEMTTPTSPWGTGTTVSGGDLAVGAIFTKKMTDKLMLGGQVRWIQEDLFLKKVSNIDYSIGTLFYTGFRTTRIAMAFQNLGPDVKVIEGGFTHQMPTVYSVGGAMEVFGKKGDLNYATVTVEHQLVVDYQPVTRIGAEIWLRNTLALRAGYRMGFELEDWSVGAGLKRQVVKGKLITVDFSYHNQKVDVFSPPLRFSLGGSF